MYSLLTEDVARERGRVLLAEAEAWRLASAGRAGRERRAAGAWRRVPGRALVALGRRLGGVTAEPGEAGAGAR